MEILVTKKYVTKLTIFKVQAYLPANLFLLKTNNYERIFI